ncbi:MAG: hypothetical protein AAFU78_19020 [Cyanobacteria bacterium J06633_2]
MNKAINSIYDAIEHCAATVLSASLWKTIKECSTAYMVMLLGVMACNIVRPDMLPSFLRIDNLTEDVQADDS